MAFVTDPDQQIHPGCGWRFIVEDRKQDRRVNGGLHLDPRGTALRKAAVSSKSRICPGRKPDPSGITAGIVTCPLLVSVALIAAK